MHRLFVALRPPPEMRHRLSGTMDGVPGARWQGDEQLHLTLRFVGEVDRHRAADVAAALGGIAAPPLDLEVAGVGSFGARGRADSLWAGIRMTPALDRLHKSVERALHRVGIPPDARAYRPHITVARLPRSTGPIDGWLAVHAGLSIPAACFDHLYLFESELGRDGAVYSAIERYPLVRSAQ